MVISMDSSYSKLVYDLESADGLRFKLTSVSCSEVEFTHLLDLISSKTKYSYPSALDADDSKIFEEYREAKHIPLIRRTHISAWLFELLDIKTEFMAVVVKGYKNRLLQGAVFSSPDPHSWN